MISTNHLATHHLLSTVLYSVDTMATIIIYFAPKLLVGTAAAQHSMIFLGMQTATSGFDGDNSIPPGDSVASHRVSSGMIPGSTAIPVTCQSCAASSGYKRGPSFAIDAKHDFGGPNHAAHSGRNRMPSSGHTGETVDATEESWSSNHMADDTRYSLHQQSTHARACAKTVKSSTSSQDTKDMLLDLLEDMEILRNENLIMKSEIASLRQRWPIQEEGSAQDEGEH